MSLSIIIPTFNESQNSYFKANLELLSNISDIEVIIADGNSTDSTQEQISSYNFKKKLNSGDTRAERLNSGIQEATSEMLFLAHPRNLLNAQAINSIKRISSEEVWGGLTHCFDNRGLFYHFTSWYSNQIRAKTRGIFYLDHCIFLHKSFIQNNEPLVPVIPIFEDTALSIKLKKLKRPLLLPQTTTTSAIRFEKNGALKQGFKNQVLKIFYFFNASGHKANAFYENKMNLNNIYDK